MKSIKKLGIIFLIIMNTSCSQLMRKNKIPEVSNSAAVLNFGHASYVKGCVDAHHRFGIKKIYFECAEKAKEYIKEMETIVRD